MDSRFHYMAKQNMSYYKNKLRYQFTKLKCPISDDYILFESYGGKRYADSVRAVYETLLSDERFRSFTFIWAFTDPDAHRELLANHHTILVRKGTTEYRQYYARARYWINNISVPDYLSPKKGQIYIETWHGTPLKRLGLDIDTDSDPRQTKSHMHHRYLAKGIKVSYFPSPSDYYIRHMMTAFGIKDKERFILTGYPRNDKLYHYTQEDLSQIRDTYHVPEDKKVILYTPTWRDNSTSKDGAFCLPKGTDLTQLMTLLGDNYILLFRAHHQISDTGTISGCDQIIDVSDAEDVTDLYLISDMMVTDYSSTMFDYANLTRPMIFHMYDKEDYELNIRGLYLSVDELPGPITTTTKELAAAIIEQDKEFTYQDKLSDFNKRYNPIEDGTSGARVVDQCLTAPPHKVPTYERCVLSIKKNFNRLKILQQILHYNMLGYLRSHGMLHNNNSLRLARLKDIHKGKRCFLIGNGPSLTGADLDLIQDEYTFGTNMVYKIFDQTDWRPSYHCVSDTIYASKLGIELSEKVKAPLFTTEHTYRRMKTKPVDTTYVHTIQTERYKVRGNVQAYCLIKATVLSLAAEMAFHMGFTEIYLLGVDCTNPHDKGGHFTDQYATKEVAETDIDRIKTRMNAKTLTTKQIGEHIIDRSMEVYHLLDEYSKKHGIKIYNATRGGNLEIFPRVKLEDVLADKGDRS